MKIKYILSLVVLVVLTISANTQLAGQDNTINFKSDILPILESNCVRCHGETDPEGGYRIDNRDEALDYVEPGDAENSEFYQYLITDEEDELMPPPDEGGPLDDSDIKLIETWINEGASWPDGLVLQEPSNDNSESDDQDQAERTNAAASQDKPNIYRAIGTLHPAAVHLPIGLLLAAGLFALLSLRGNFVMSDCAYYCLWVGTLGAVGACLTGWWFVLDQHPNEYVSQFEGLQNTDHKLFWHRTSGIIATLFALLLALFAASARNRNPDDGVSWKLGLILLAVAIGLVGHQGGKLTWKASHYDELLEVVDQFIPGIVPKAEDEAKPTLDSAEPDETEIGETSTDDA